MQRYDSVAFAATKTAEGFIRDSPIVGRTGILKYTNADGSDRYEYRPPEEAFKAESLATLMGKPITIGHHGLMNAGKASKIAPVGTVLSAGRQDGNDIRADIVIYNLDTADRELSCGYTLTLEETPGTTPEGEHYDAIQRDIRYNHVAVVPKGRAGVARLNMDGNQEFENEREDEENMAEKTMTKIRLDGGLEYDAAPEVGVYVENLRKENEKLRADSAEADQKAKKAFDELQAKYDAALAINEEQKKDAEKAAEEAKANFDSAVKARVELLGVAAKHKIEKADSMTDKDIKLAVIKAVRGDKVNLDGKSDDYIEAAFDMAKDEVKAREDGMAQQRQAVGASVQNQGGKDTHADEDDPQAALDALVKAESELYLKEDK